MKPDTESHISSACALIEKEYKYYSSRIPEYLGRIKSDIVPNQESERHFYNRFPGFKKWEAGESTPQTSSLWQFSSTYHVPVSKMMFGDFRVGSGIVPLALNIADGLYSAEQRVKWLRALYGISPGNMADIISCTIGEYRLIESGERGLSTKTLYRLSLYFKASPDLLLTGGDDNFSDEFGRDESNRHLCLAFKRAMLKHPDNDLMPEKETTKILSDLSGGFFKTEFIVGIASLLNCQPRDLIEIAERELTAIIAAYRANNEPPNDDFSNDPFYLLQLDETFADLNSMGAVDTNPYVSENSRHAPLEHPPEDTALRLADFSHYDALITSYALDRVDWERLINSGVIDIKNKKDKAIAIKSLKTLVDALRNSNNCMFFDD